MDNQELRQSDALFKRLDEGFDRIDKHFTAFRAEVDQRFKQIDQRFQQVDQRFERLQAEVHRNGVLLEEQSKELKLAVRTFQSLHDIEQQRLELIRNAMDQRLTYVERTAGRPGDG